MKKIKFLVDVSDKHTKENYTEGQIKEFEDIRANEILKAKRPDGKSYAEEVEEEIEEKPVKRGRKKKTEQ